MSLRLVQLSTTGGLLRNARIDLHEGLNVFVGGPGTCKSTVIETLRFVFGCDGDRPGASDRIEHALGSGVARCEVLIDGRTANVSRAGGSDTPRFQGGDPERFGIEIYSQGDLQKLAVDVGRRLEILDASHRSAILAFLEQRRELREQLLEVAAQISPKRAAVERLTLEVSGLAAAKQRLAEYQATKPKIPDALKAERDAHEDRQAVLARVQKALADVRSRLLPVATDRQAEATVKALKRLASDLAAHGEAAVPLRDLFAGAVAALSAVLELELSEPGLKNVDTGLRLAFDKLDAPYKDLLTREKGLTVWSIAEEEHKRRVATIEASKKALEEARAELAELLARRKELRASLASIRDAISALREKELSEIAKHAPPSVALRLSRSAARDELKVQLAGLLAGSGLRNQDATVDLIASRFSPADVIDLVESEDGEQRLAAVGVKSPGRLLGFLAGAPGLHTLETVALEDVLEVELDGRPIERLSNGQRAIALLPLVVRGGRVPLVFDQPEDDLDSVYVVDMLAQRLPALKKVRQLLFVTHSANVAILGQADRVFVMSMAEPDAAAPPQVGTIDECRDALVRTLEGGEQALAARARQYGFDLVAE